MRTANLEELGIVDAAEVAEQSWDNDAGTKLPKESEVLKPFAWKVLVMPMRPETVSKGGIIMPQVRLETDLYLNYVGQVVTLGPLAYKHAKWKAMGLKAADMPKRGDWMIYSTNQYQRIDFRGTKLILLNDDSFLGIVPKGVDPWSFKLER